MHYLWIFFSYLLAIAFIAGNLAIYVFVFRVGIQAFLALIFVTYALNLLLTMGIFFQRRHSSAKLSWILVMTIFPFIGHIIYLTSGQKYPHRKNYLTYVQNYSRLVKGVTHLFELQKTKSEGDSLLSPLSYFTKNPILGLEAKFFHRTYEYFETLFEELKKAKKQILLVSYSVAEGEMFYELVNILKTKREEGIEIKWLVDDFGRRKVAKKHWKKLRKLDIEISFIAPLHFITFASINFYRNHRKFIIIDQKEVFNGGSNIGDSYASLDPSLGFYNDFNYSLKGPYIANYFELFSYMWSTWNKNRSVVHFENHDLDLDNQKKLTSKGVFFEDGPELNDELIEKVLIKLIVNAKTSIKISTPYFSLPESVLQALKIALLSGVKIEIYYPGVTKQKLIHNIGLNELRRLTSLNLEVYHSKAHFSHAKIGLFDNKIAFMGTVNMDIRSLYAQYETIDIFEGEKVLEMQTCFEILKENSLLKPNVTIKTSNFLANLIYWILKPIV